MQTFTQTVSFSGIDKDGKLSLCNTANAFQDGIMLHNTKLDISPIELLDRNRAWYVNSWHIVFVDRPKFNEAFFVDTWVYQLRGTLASWNIVMKNSSGDVCAYGDSKWFFADSTTGKPARIEADIKEAYVLEEPYNMESGSRRIECPIDLDFQYLLPVSPNYLDSNGHVNNGEYLRLGLNLLPIDFDAKELRAEYISAAHAGDTFYLYAGVFENKFYISLAKEDKSPYCLIEIIGK